MQRIIIASVFAVGIAACISERREAADVTTRDATSAEVTDDVSTLPDTASDVGPDSGSEVVSDVVTSPDVPDTGVLGCAGVADCVAPSPECQRWDCIDRACILVPDDGTCDDGNACTGAGTCVDGRCEDGPELVCDQATSCKRPACDPQVGCIEVLVDDGFCGTSDGSNWGRCSDTRMAPPDLCSDTGVCEERATSAATPLPKDAIVGKWFFVTQSMLIGDAFTLAGTMSFDVNGAWSGGTFRTTQGALAAADVVDRGWCIDANRGLAFDFGLDHYVGQIAPSGDHFTAAGARSNQVALGIRPSGDIADVDGTYNVVMMVRGDNDGSHVYRGTLVFDHGCLDEGSSLQTDDGDLQLDVVDDGACLASAGESLVAIPLQLSSPASGNTVAITLLGAVGPRADALLFARAKSNDDVEYGMVVATRLTRDPQKNIGGNTRWVFGFHEATDGAPRIRGFRGLLTVDATVAPPELTLTNGIWDAVQVLGERVAVDDFGRFVMTIHTPLELRTFSGYLDPQAELGVFYAVDAAASWLETDEVSEQPSGPAFGLVVRRPAP